MIMIKVDVGFVKIVGTLAGGTKGILGSVMENAVLILGGIMVPRVFR